MKGFLKTLFSKAFVDSSFARLFKKSAYAGIEPTSFQKSPKYLRFELRWLPLGHGSRKIIHITRSRSRDPHDTNKIVGCRICCLLSFIVNIAAAIVI